MQYSIRACAVAVVTLGMLVFTQLGRTEDKPAAAPAAWSPPLYAYCMDVADAKKRPFPEQVAMLRELGFDGVGYPLWLDDSMDKNLQVLDRAGLKLYMVWTSLDIGPKGQPCDPRVLAALRKLKGRPTTVSVLIRGFPPGDRRGIEPAVKALRELGDAAAECGLRVSIYNHVGDWTDSVPFALEVVKKVDRPNVGINFNLCHWLKVDGAKDYRPIVRDNAAKIFVAAINGAKVGSAEWTNGLIQPLDQGDFDNPALLALLRQAGYRGPVALMCYGIPGDAREHLERSMRVWKSWKVSGK
jgi:sugar phosphate isomerase/epimerase